MPYTIEILVSFNDLREGEIFSVEPEFLERFGQYVRVLHAPEEASPTGVLKPGEAVSIEPKKLPTAKKANGNGKDKGSDLQGEGEQPSS